jgi:Uma2 family endonuclease
MMLTAKSKSKSPKRVASPNGTVLPKEFMTEREFVEWAFSDEDIRAEWEDGKVILMAPVSDAEDDLNGWLLNILRPFIEHHDLGIIRGPQFMVRFGRQRRRRVPDLMFISKARQHLVQKNHIEGAPDLAMEIVSPDSQTRDRRKKYQEYEKAGVREYWIIDPVSQQMEAHALHRGRYSEIEQSEDGVIASILLSGFYLKPAWLWSRPHPKVFTIQKELGLF